MPRVTAYWDGKAYTLERRGAQAKEVTVLLQPDHYVATSSTGDQLIYCRASPYGQTLENALRLGWCEIDGEDGREEKSMSAS